MAWLFQGGDIDNLQIAPSNPAMKADRNFDDLAPRFQRKVYGGIKGQIRLAVLEKDLTDPPQQDLRKGEQRVLEYLIHLPFPPNLRRKTPQVP